jgi:nitrate/nitrite transporter NarK
MEAPSSKNPPWYFLLLLILAGESVFILPFVLARVFRPTVLEAFQINNLQLGLCFSVYGVVALLSYLFGGPLADKFLPRKLMAVALWSTALGGWIYATFPGYATLQVLYGYWGFTTIFLFWAPMIKATRIWGGHNSQGKAFGFLDGGRGLVGALFGFLGVYIFSLFASSVKGEVTVLASQQAFKPVIWASSAIVALVGVLVWFFMAFNENAENNAVAEKISRKEIRQVLRLPSIWLLMVIILCAYVGYKITDVFSLYATDVMQYDAVQSAQVGTFLLFIRPVVGVAIGLLADKSRATLWLLIGFILSFFGALLFATGWVSAQSHLWFFVSTLIVALGVYATRTLYFAVMQQGKIPLWLTGTAVGLISIVGYTPDIFAGPAMGYLLDNWPGEQGHQYVFAMLALFCFLGSMAAWVYFRMYRKPKSL